MAISVSQGRDRYIMQGDPGYTEQLLAQAEARIRKLESQLAQKQARIDQLHADYTLVVQTNAWRWVQRFYRFRNFIFPPNTIIHDWLKWFVRRLTVKPKFTVEKTYGSLYERWRAIREPVALNKYPKTIVDTHQVAPITFVLLAEADAQATIQSLLQQDDPNWQLITSISDLVDPRIQIRRDLFSSDVIPAIGWVSLLRSGDKLAPGAVRILRHVIQQKPALGMIYADHDLHNEDGQRVDPWFKPDWSPETLRSHNYIQSAVIWRSDLVRQTGGWSSEALPVLDYDLSLRVSETGTPIHHVPLVLWHRSSSAEDSTALQEAQIQAVQRHLDRQKIRADVSVGLTAGCHQVRYRFGRPMVSIIIPSKDQPEMLDRCVASILESGYPQKEILILDNGSQSAQAHRHNEQLAQKPGVRVMAWNHPFNYASINNFGVRQTKGDLLLFMNNDMQAISTDWLERLLEHACRKEVGAAGAKLLFPDNTIQHAGVIVGMNDESSGHYFRYFPADAAGYMNRLLIAQNLCALTGACLMTRREVFEELQGFDELFGVNFNDIDLCLRMRQRGYQIVWTPHALLYHFEGQTRGIRMTPAKHVIYEMEVLLFRERWKDYLTNGDPYFSPNLNRKVEDCSIQV